MPRHEIEVRRSRLMKSAEEEPVNIRLDPGLWLLKQRMEAAAANEERAQTRRAMWTIVSFAGLCLIGFFGGMILFGSS